MGIASGTERSAEGIREIQVSRSGPRGEIREEQCRNDIRTDLRRRRDTHATEQVDHGKTVHDRAGNREQMMFHERHKRRREESVRRRGHVRLPDHGAVRRERARDEVGYRRMIARAGFRRKRVRGDDSPGYGRARKEDARIVRGRSALLGGHIRSWNQGFQRNGSEIGMA